MGSLSFRLAASKNVWQATTMSIEESSVKRQNCEAGAIKQKTKTKEVPRPRTGRSRGLCTSESHDEALAWLLAHALRHTTYGEWVPPSSMGFFLYRSSVAHFNLRGYRAQLAIRLALVALARTYIHTYIHTYMQSTAAASRR